MDLELKGKNVLITGASTGIGRAIATSFAHERATVAINSRNGETLKKTADAITSETGARVISVSGDVSKPDDVQRIVSQTETELGSIDALICNAGGPPSGPFSDLTREAFVGALELNLLSTTGLCQAAVPGMIERGKGAAIVALTSISAKQPIDGLILSNMARAGVTGFCRSLANEVAVHGIRVNSVGPGFTRTDRLEDLKTKLAERSDLPPDEIQKNWERDIPMKRLATPREVADVVVFLCSGRSTYVTGTMLVVDGGFCRGLL